MIEAKVIADSIWYPGLHPAEAVPERGYRLTTMEVNMHRFVLAEFNTHRLFSRSSASSRAIPVEKQIARVKETPAYPIEWPCEQPGMSGGAALEGRVLRDAWDLFETVHDSTVEAIERYLKEHPEKSERLHKSLINRLMEPFMWHRVIVTSTYWENFRFQRVSKKAMPEMREAADAMMQALDASTPVELGPGEYHLPYIDDETVVWAEHEMHRLGAQSIQEMLKEISTARCARVSYLTHDGRRDPSEDLNLYRKLVEREPGAEDDPIHWAPLEHVASPMYNRDVITRGNFVGWQQFRHEVEQSMGVNTKR